MAVNLHTRKTKKGTSYVLIIYTDGRVIKRTLKIDWSLPERQRRSIAEIQAAEAQKEIMTDSRGFTQNKSRNILKLFDDLVAQHYRGNRKYSNLMQHLRLHFGEVLTTKQLTGSALEGWKTYLVKTFTGETPNTRWRSTMRLIALSRQYGFITHNPAYGIKPPSVPDNLSKQILSGDELRLLAKTAMPHPEICRAFLWCCLTGMGRADIVILRWDQIDISRKQVKYKRAKSNQVVPVDLSDAALRLLPERITEKVYPMFPSDSFCSRILKDWVKAAGINKSISWYCARHSFAILLLEGGADLLTVSKLLGHTSTKHTARYLKYIDALKRRAIATLPDLEV